MNTDNEEKLSLREAKIEKCKLYQEEINHINSSSRLMKVIFTLLFITYLCIISVIPFMMITFTLFLTLLSLMCLFSEGCYFQKKKIIKRKIEDIIENPQEKEENNSHKKSSLFWKGVFNFENSLYFFGLCPVLLGLLTFPINILLSINH